MDRGQFLSTEKCSLRNGEGMVCRGCRLLEQALLDYSKNGSNALVPGRGRRFLKTIYFSTIVQNI